MSYSLPKISIITPSYNQGEFLEATIQSIISQNYPNLEYIVIDGGSKDNSVSIIEKYAWKIDYWVSEKDSGQTEAINKGLAKATGEIITWINSDDQLMPETLHKVAAHFSENSNIKALHGRNINYGGDVKTHVYGADETTLPYSYLSGLPFAQPSSFFKREVLNDFTLGESFHYGMDYDLFVYIALNYDILGVEDIFSRYRFHEQSKSVQGSLNFSADYAKVFSKMLRSFDFTQEIIEEMKKLELYVEGDDRYKVTKNFTPEFVMRAFLYHLEFHIKFLYEALDLKRCYAITEFIKNYNPDFYAQRPEFAEINTRSKWLNKSLMQGLRKLKRSMT